MRQRSSVAKGFQLSGAVCATLVIVFASLPLLTASSSRPDAKTIIQRSVEALKADWKAAPQYNYSERDRDEKGTKTYRIKMILGSPYKILAEVNGQPLSQEDQKKEQRKLDDTISQRTNESKEQTEKRTTAYLKDRERDHRLTEELTKAFTFKVIGERRLGGHQVYVLQATRLPSYRPPDKETEVLTGMRGKLWIDTATYQWVKVEAEVIEPVSIVGFLATVEPGTRFELESEPVPGGAWLPSHFTMRSRAKILSFINHNDSADETYFDYQRAGQQPVTTR